jgi:hypothetical protein
MTGGRFNVVQVARAAGGIVSGAWTPGVNPVSLLTYPGAVPRCRWPWKSTRLMLTW